MTECICSVPWWIWRISVDASVDGGSSRDAHLVVGDNRVPVELPVQPAQSAQTAQSTLGAPSTRDGVEGAAHGEMRSLLVVREEPLRCLFSQLKPYELAQLSALSFVFGLYAALHFGVSWFLAVPLLAAIPICRISPELPCLWRAQHCGTTPHSRHALASAALCLFLSWLVLICFSAAQWGDGSHAPAAVGERRAPTAWQSSPRVPRTDDPLTASDCAGLPGLDCSSQLARWAGEGNCAVLAETNGTCAAYCELRGRPCRRAMDDDASGLCALNRGGHWRQSPEADGCEQRWRTQLCACAGGAGGAGGRGRGGRGRRAAGALLPRGRAVLAAGHAGPGPHAGRQRGAVPGALRPDAGMRALHLEAGRGLPSPGVLRGGPGGNRYCRWAVRLR